MINEHNVYYKTPSNIYVSPHILIHPHHVSIISWACHECSQHVHNDVNPNNCCWILVMLDAGLIPSTFT